MKFVKRLTVFFIIPMSMFAGGFASGMAVMDYFYPGRNIAERSERMVVLADDPFDNLQTPANSGGADGSEELSAVTVSPAPDIVSSLNPDAAGLPGGGINQGGGTPDEAETGNGTGSVDAAGDIPSNKAANQEAVVVGLQSGVTINADTTYIIQEYMRNSGDITEETIPVPETFVGMDRELFVSTMNEFSDYPPLSEMEKGFIGCEVVSFSPQRVLVRKTYEDEDKEMPAGYYLVNENNIVTVYYGDLETVYLNTNIELTRLPEELRQEIIFTKFMAGEEELYNFLEAYSS